MSRTAVCLSGQPRTIKHCAKSIMEYFGDVDYFCHVWDYNDHKVKNKETGVLEFQYEQLVYEEVLESIKIFKPLNYMIESVTALGSNRFRWDSLLYSHLMAVNMKKQWEIEHDFRYDWVVKGRYDLVYPHGKKFRLSERTNMRNCGGYYPNLDLFTAHIDRIPCEFLQINISDVSYYGSSAAMDVAADLYWHCQREYANTKNEIKRLGPGTWMSDYIANNNLRFYEDRENLAEVIFRTTSIGYSIEHDWHNIVINHGDIYK
jgi:hypothetical protein